MALAGKAGPTSHGHTRISDILVCLALPSNVSANTLPAHPRIFILDITGMRVRTDDCPLHGYRLAYVKIWVKPLKSRLGG